MASAYDHDHDTDIVRAALCVRHNWVIGLCGDQWDTMQTVVDWLQCANLGFVYSEWTRQRKRVAKRKYHVGHREQKRTSAAKYRATHAEQERVRHANYYRSRRATL